MTSITPARAWYPLSSPARPTRGTSVHVARTYGFGVLSERITAAEYWSSFHGVDERIDVESLHLSV